MHIDATRECILVIGLRWRGARAGRLGSRSPWVIVVASPIQNVHRAGTVDFSVDFQGRSPRDNSISAKMCGKNHAANRVVFIPTLSGFDNLQQDTNKQRAQPQYGPRGAAAGKSRFLSVFLPECRLHPLGKSRKAQQGPSYAYSNYPA